MIRLALIFLVIALVAALFGFSGAAHVGVEAARLLVFVFLGLAVLTFIEGYGRSRRLRDLW